MLKGRIERLIVKVLLWVFIAFLVVVTVFLLGATWEAYQKERLAWREHANAKEQYEEVYKRHETLVKEIETLSNERGREAEFRTRFPVAREGEEVIVLVDAPEAPQEEQNDESRGIWGSVRSWLGF